MRRAVATTDNRNGWIKTSSFCQCFLGKMTYKSAVLAVSFSSCICVIVLIITFEQGKRSNFQDNRHVSQNLNGDSEVSSQDIKFSAALKNCSKSVLCKAIDGKLKLQLQDMDLETLKLIFHGFLTSYVYECSTSKRFGINARGLGNYHVCMNSSAEPVPKKCLVYSFGIAGDWAFDEDFAKYGCEVHSFDPSIGKEDHTHPPDIQFHNLGLFGDDFVDHRGWRLHKVSSIKKMLGHEKRILDVLKIDVEGAEWPALRNLVFQDIEDLKTIKQLILELHSPLLKGNTLKKRDFIEIIYYFKELRNLGFMLFKSFQVNSCCGRFSPFMPRIVREQCCYEVSFINARYL